MENTFSNPEVIKIINEGKNIKDPFKNIEYYQKIVDKVLSMTTCEEPHSKQLSKHRKFLNELK